MSNQNGKPAANPSAADKAAKEAADKAAAEAAAKEAADKAAAEAAAAADKAAADKAAAEAAAKEAADKAAADKAAAEAAAQKASGNPAHYSGKVRGRYKGTRRDRVDPYTKLRFSATGEGISNKQTGEITTGSWLDMELRAGTIKFQPED